METKDHVEKDNAAVKVELEIEELEKIVAPMTPTCGGGGKLVLNHNETFLMD